MEICHLPVKLTEQEILNKADMLAKSLRERDSLDEKRKSQAKTAKDEIDRADLEISKLARTVESGFEDRPIECRWERDDARSAMNLIRLDTGELVSSRSMTSAELDEKQIELLGVSGGKKGKKTASVEE
jgi:hypothetical protein